MGRTVPSMTQHILDEMQSWSQFRRALRVEEREVFDQLFRSVRMHVAEVGMAARLLPFEAMLMSMLVSQGVRLHQLEQKIFLEQGTVGDTAMPKALPERTALPYSQVS